MELEYPTAAFTPSNSAAGGILYADATFCGGDMHWPLKMRRFHWKTARKWRI